MSFANLESFRDRLQVMLEAEEVFEEEIEDFLRDLRPLVRRSRFKKVAALTREGRLPPAIELLNVSPPGFPWVSSGMGTAFLVAAFFFFSSTSTETTEATASVEWPTTPGTILSARSIETVTASPSAGNRSATVTYHAEIKYQYEVEGRRQMGDRVSFGYLSSKDQAQAVVDRYPVGAEVKVFYNAISPEHSVLEPGRQETTSIGFLAGWLFTVMAGAWLLVPILIFAYGWFRP